jgi:processive 1,2-diacylglycerol beta-glucosyltransferase
MSSRTRAAPEGRALRGGAARVQGVPGRTDVLLFGAGYGAGHNHAGAAVAEALGELRPGWSTVFVDYLRFFPPAVASATVSLYSLLARRWPVAYGFAHGVTSRMAGGPAWRTVVHSLGRAELRGMVHLLRPRVIVCTHPLPAGVLSDLRGRGEPLPAVVSVVTDHGLHGEWIQPHVHRYCVPTPELAAFLAQRGIDPERVRVTGIPVRADFRRPLERARARRRQGLAAGERLVLFLTSANGLMGGVVSACRALLALPEEFRLTVVCGRDRSLLPRLSALAARRGRGRMRALGFRPDVAELMAAADLLVTKAGGITTAEALALGLPSVIYRPTPGQETPNAALLERRGAALVARSPRELAEAVGRLLARPEERRRLASAAVSLGRPDAALRVAGEVIDLCDRAPRPA